MNMKTQKTDAEWRDELSPERYEVLRRKGTERAFTGEYNDTKDPGVYRCAGCGAELFRSEAKFDWLGWPSFVEPANLESVVTETDTSYGMIAPRSCAPPAAGTSATSSRTAPGRRTALLHQLLRPRPGADMTETATFAAGCFWGVEVDFRNTPGVTDVQVGYTGGHVDEPDCKTVCSGSTGHAEAVEVTFDPSEVSYGELVDRFWSLHDPTQVNRQGWDVGTQYRSAIFTHTPEQAEVAAESKARAQARFGKPIATEITPASTFWPAEEYTSSTSSRTAAPPVGSNCSTSSGQALAGSCPR